MKKIILTFIIILLSGKIIAQNEIISQEYYEGTINKNIQISFYLKIHEDGCPKIHASAIYKYKKNKKDSWILLNSFFSKGQQQFTFVELKNTGILLLNKKQNNLKGLWISPDGKTQLEVELKKINIDNKSIEKLENKLEEEFYYANDC